MNHGNPVSDVMFIPKTCITRLYNPIKHNLGILDTVEGITSPCVIAYDCRTQKTVTVEAGALSVCRSAWGREVFMG